MTVSELTKKIIDGDYPDIPRPTDERVFIIPDQIARWYAHLAGTILLNNIPGDVAVTGPKRLALFDDIMRVINVYHVGRLNALLSELDAIIDHARKESDMWTSRKSMNNITTFITEFWAWDDMDRVNFLNGEEQEVEVEELSVEEEDIIDPEERLHPEESEEFLGGTS